ncbi:hypothetical protein [Methanogenium cariaci]|uniref:hypothetical protein n=1 Tax=Methanogenium cariaci TaxID=2197 RepID=UPI001C4703B4|nr:hypothetical protein [Methanogenium cariaci]
MFPKKPLVGTTREDNSLKSRYSLHLLAVKTGRDILYAPWRYTVFAEGGQVLSLLGTKEDAEQFAADYELVPVGGIRSATQKKSEKSMPDLPKSSCGPTRPTPERPSVKYHSENSMALSSSSP